MNDRFSQILAFTALLDTFRNVERQLYATGQDRLENDSEHSYHLAMLAWYVVESHGLPLDRGKVLMYALAHDIVEAYAGDTYAFSKDAAHKESKQAREHAAAMRLKREFPEFPSLHECIASYEKRDDSESKFVYALDKIEPLFHILNDAGRTWKTYEITIDMLVEFKKEKVKETPEVEEHFNYLIALLRQHEETYFGTSGK